MSLTWYMAAVVFLSTAGQFAALPLMVGKQYTCPSPMLCHDNRFLFAVSDDIDKTRESTPEAQYELGMRYANGSEGRHDYLTALLWFKRAAEEGNPRAELAIGTMYEDGHGVIQDYGKAFSWYKRAAKHNNAYAQYILGAFYATGDHKLVGRSQEQAAMWVRRSAMNGNCWAQETLGEMYHRGEGVEQDDIQSFAWLGLAEDQHHPFAARIKWEISKNFDVKKASQAELQRLSVGMAFGNKTDQDDPCQ